MSKCVILFLVAVLIIANEAKNIDTRIVEGSPAVQFQFPWHASLRITVSTSTLQTFCGASVISNQFILTAASCLRSAVTIQVDLGSVLFSTPLISIHTNAFLLHPGHNANFNHYDIALIRLPTPIAFSTNIRSINLPTLSQASDAFVDTEVYIAGFGVTTPTGNIMSERLNFAHQRVITNEECLNDFGSQFIQASTICAVGINSTLQTPCFGDRGGALVAHVAGTWTQVGITSLFHSGGCTGETAAGFTRVSSFLEWISINTGIPIIS